MKTKLTFLLSLTFLLYIFNVLVAEAHRSGCHRWHSCPSDSGSYVCGDTRRCSGCPDNQYYKTGSPVSRQSKPSKNFKSSSPFITEEPLNTSPSKKQTRSSIARPKVSVTIFRTTTTSSTTSTFIFRIKTKN